MRKVRMPFLRWGFFLLLSVLILLMLVSYAPCEQASSYRLREGDRVSIRVFDHENLSITATVPPGGIISYPLIGKLELAGKTTDELETEITRALEKKYLKSANVIALVIEYAKQSVYILGAVGRPDAYHLPPNRQLSVSQLVSLAGGFNNDANRNGLKVIRRTDEKVTLLKVSFEEITEQNNFTKDLILQPNDTLFVPVLQKIYVLGSVNRPGGYSLSTIEDMTATKAISLAGGFTRVAAPSKTTVIRTSSDSKKSSIVVNISSIISGGSKSKDFAIKPGDIIYVPESFF